MKVKICGIMDLETALFAVEQGADALGFVFAESKRKITPEKAKEIITQLPEDLLKVGVFVNETHETIEEIIAVSGINIVQLHGDEPPEFCTGFSVPVIKALSIGSDADVLKINDYPSEYVLLDSPKGKYRGGNGTTFDWSLLHSIPSVAKKIILAGGLTRENVADAIRRTNPDIVDVSSGVETDGQKDFTKITQFINLAKDTHKEEIK